MTERRFLRNEILVHHEDGTQHRLLRFDQRRDLAWLIELGAKNALPQELPYSTLGTTFVYPQELTPEVEEVDYISEINANVKPKSTAISPILVTKSRDASPAQLAVAKRAWYRIAPLIDDERLFYPETRWRLLQERELELKAEAERRSSQPAGDEFCIGSAKTMLNDIRAYWQGGQNWDALLGAFRWRDHQGPEFAGTGSRGAKREDGSTAYQLKQQDLDWMREVLMARYLVKDTGISLAKTLEYLHSLHYSYRDGNGTSYLKHPHQAPTYRQLERYLKQNWNLESRLRLRKGDKKFENDHNAKTGSVQLDCHGVGHIGEFDATIVDVYLVSSKNRKLIVGKPTLYLIVDRASRMIIGWYIGLENACYSAAMQAIVSIGVDKRALCRRYGIPYDPLDWIAHAIVPQCFLADQGELVKKEARAIVGSLKSTISNTAGLRPTYKPLVECGFKQVHTIIAADTPGYKADADMRHRRTNNNEQNASLTLEEFTGVIIDAIILYNRSVQTEYPLTLQQVSDEVPAIPRLLYQHGMETRMGELDRMDFNRVRQDLMPRAQAKVNENGIVFEKVTYSCPEAVAKGWFVEARGKTAKVTIAFDYRCVDEIIVYSPDGSGECFVASLHADSEKFRGWSFPEVGRHFDMVRKLNKQALEDKRQSQHQFRTRVRPLVANAVDLTNAEVGDASRASRRVDTAPARAQELRAERQQTAGVFHPHATNQASQTAFSSPGTVGQSAPPPATLKGAAPSDEAPKPPAQVIPIKESKASARARNAKAKAPVPTPASTVDSGAGSTPEGQSQSMNELIAKYSASFGS
jgi:putative transposase